MRLIDADKLMLSLNDNYLANCPTGNETLAVQDYRESMCEGLEIAMATVEGTPTVGGWISVKDRLPVRPPDVCGLLVRRQWYLVALESGAVLTLSYEFDEDRWQGVGSPVTHWMPLPEPPKEEPQCQQPTP